MSSNSDKELFECPKCEDKEDYDGFVWSSHEVNEPNEVVQMAECPLCEQEYLQVFEPTHWFKIPKTNDEGEVI